MAELGGQANAVEGAYRRLWASLHRSDGSDLSHHELELLHHVPAGRTVDLGTLARHLALPKSTASVVVKSLAARGFVDRARDTTDERRLALSLTASGRRRVEDDTVLDVARLAAALRTMRPEDRRSLVLLLDALAGAAEKTADSGEKEEPS